MKNKALHNQPILYRPTLAKLGKPNVASLPRNAIVTLFQRLATPKQSNK